MKENGMSWVTFEELEWDTNFFGVTCSKVVLKKPLSMSEWQELKRRFIKYQFVSIENCNSEPWNSQLIGYETSAFLADVNVQFQKTNKTYREKPHNTEQYQAMKKNEKVLQLAEFKYSKFVEDSRLRERGGNKVYQQWILNSFEKPDKYFALSKDDNNQINGFVLYSFQETTCVIELIAAEQNHGNRGIGTRLFQSIEHEVYRRGFENIRVGTQIRNIEAINFYHKMGCRQIGCHQIYHLWNC